MEMKGSVNRAIFLTILLHLLSPEEGCSAPTASLDTGSFLLKVPGKEEEGLNSIFTKEKEEQSQLRGGEDILNYVSSYQPRERQVPYPPPHPQPQQELIPLNPPSSPSPKDHEEEEEKSEREVKVEAWSGTKGALGVEEDKWSSFVVEDVEPLPLPPFSPDLPPSQRGRHPRDYPAISLLDQISPLLW